MIAFPQHRLKVRNIQRQGTDITNLNNSSAMIFYAVIKTLLDFLMLLRVGGKGRGMLKLEHFRKLNAVLFCYFVYQDEKKKKIWFQVPVQSITRVPGSCASVLKGKCTFLFVFVL